MAPIIASAAAAALAICASPQATLPSGLDVSGLRQLVVQHDGRWMPMDTLARDYVEQVTGDQFFRGADPVVTLLAWTFDVEAWAAEPLITIANAELRGELDLSETETAYSFTELVQHQRLLELIGELSHLEGSKPNPLEAKVGDINERLLALQSVFRSEAIRPVPHPTDELAAWHSLAALARSLDPELEAARASWTALGDAFRAGDPTAFDAAVASVRASLAALPSAYTLPPARIAAELRYNDLRPFRTAWILMAVGAVLGAAALGIRRRWFDVLAMVAVLTGWGVLSYGLWLRGSIAGRLPAANMFESLLFLSWGTGAFAIVAMLFVRNRGVPLTASTMGALALCLADTLPMDQFIRPITPVLLDTVWMSIHVPIIMVSYSVLTIAVLVAHVQVVVMAARPERGDLAESVDGAHAWYMHAGAVLLFAGIVTGSMWAASSWGRYWGWDPKEVWSLIAFLGYMVIMHVRVSHERVPAALKVVAAALGVTLIGFALMKLGPVSLPKVLALAATLVAMAFFVVATGRLATAVKSILAFWMIIMTYVGVNYVLGIGLHSYGFGTGAIAGRVFLIGTIDLAIVGLCAAVFLTRRRLATA